VFLTTWGVYLSFISELLIFISSIIEHNSTWFWGERYLWRFTWVLYEIMVPTNILITFVFWVFLYSNLPPELKEGGRLIETITSHSVPFIVTQIDFWVNGWLFKYSHLIFVLMFCTFYMIVNIIATFANWPPYDIITWQDWQTAVFVPALYILVAGSFLGFTWIS